MEVTRVYEDAGRRSTERRVLVDRLWPRGVRKSGVTHELGLPEPARLALEFWGRPS